MAWLGYAPATQWLLLSNMAGLKTISFDASSEHNITALHEISIRWHIGGNSRGRHGIAHQYATAVAHSHCAARLRRWRLRRAGGLRGARI